MLFIVLSTDFKVGMNYCLSLQKASLLNLTSQKLQHYCVLVEIRWMITFPTWKKQD